MTTKATMDKALKLYLTIQDLKNNPEFKRYAGPELSSNFDNLTLRQVDGWFRDQPESSSAWLDAIQQFKSER